MSEQNQSGDAPMLHFDVHDGVGPHLLLVHGFLSSRAHWAPNLERLAEVSRPVTIELWAHGRSPSPEAPEDYVPGSYVQAFERVREAIGCERWIICGQSLGAAFTLRYALERPDRVTGHIFTNSAASVANEEKMESDRLEGLAAAIEAGGVEAIRANPMFPGNMSRIPEEVRAALGADAELHDPAGLATMLRHGSATSSRSRLGQNAVPTLLVVGEREKGFVRGRQYFEEHLPHIRVVTTDAGHGVNLEAPDAFNDAAVEFIRTLN